MAIEGGQVLLLLPTSFSPSPAEPRALGQGEGLADADSRTGKEQKSFGRSEGRGCLRQQEKRHRRPKASQAEGNGPPVSADDR